MKFIIRSLALLVRLLLLAPLIGITLFFFALMLYPMLPKYFARYIAKIALVFAPDLENEAIIGFASEWSRLMLKRKHNENPN